MIVIVILCAVVAWVWQTQVVPTSRTNLAISKSRGSVKEYLDELRESGRVEADEYDVSSANNLQPLEESRDPLHESSSLLLLENDGRDSKSTFRKTQMSSSTSRAFERWVFSDWLLDNKSARKPGRQKEPALPILKDAKWNSGDNPVLAATLLIGLGVLLSAVTERVATTAS
jgi:hypothetical protein